VLLEVPGMPKAQKGGGGSEGGDDTHTPECKFLHQELYTTA